MSKPVLPIPTAAPAQTVPVSWTTRRDHPYFTSQTCARRLALTNRTHSGGWPTTEKNAWSQSHFWEDHFTGIYAGVVVRNPAYLRLLQRMRCRDRPPMAETHRARITNAVKCLPPQNKPERACGSAQFATVSSLRNWPPQTRLPVLALGAISAGAILRAARLKASAAKFRHGAQTRCPTDARCSIAIIALTTIRTRAASARMFRDVFRPSAPTVF